MNESHGPVIALGQQFLPNHIGTSSGIMLGLTIGGMVTSAIGWVGDKFGLHASIYIIAARTPKEKKYCKL